MIDWPLHVTLADVFAVDRNATGIDAKLEEMLLSRSSVTVKVLREADLGTTGVVLVEKSNRIIKLHKSIIDLLQANGAMFNSPEFTRGGFLPHSTVQNSGRLYMGDRLNIDSVTLIDMFPNEDWRQRKVLNTFKLQEIQFSSLANNAASSFIE